MRFFKKAADAVRKGLARTRSVLGAGLRSLLAGRRLDDALIDEIEASLIGADVGVKATKKHACSSRRSTSSTVLHNLSL